METLIQCLKPDSKCRISLGKLAKGISSFRAYKTEDGSVVLEPCSDIPDREKWLYDNPEALKAVKKGLEQAGRRETEAEADFSSLEEDKSLLKRFKAVRKTLGYLEA